MMQQPKTKSSADELTTPIGLYNFACSYHQAARALEELKLRTTHPKSPVAFLYFHAIELFLKSFLRLHGHTVADLASRKFGHDYTQLQKRATELDFFFMDEDLVVLEWLAKSDMWIRSRYIRTGYFEEPTSEALDRTAKSLRESVRQELKAKGIPAKR